MMQSVGSFIKCLPKHCKVKSSCCDSERVTTTLAADAVALHSRLDASRGIPRSLQSIQFHEFASTSTEPLIFPLSRQMPAGWGLDFLWVRNRLFKIGESYILHTSPPMLPPTLLPTPLQRFFTTCTLPFLLLELFFIHGHVVGIVLQAGNLYLVHAELLYCLQLAPVLAITNS